MAIAGWMREPSIPSNNNALLRTVCADARGATVDSASITASVLALDMDSQRRGSGVARPDNRQTESVCVFMEDCVVVKLGYSMIQQQEIGDGNWIGSSRCSPGMHRPADKTPERTNRVGFEAGGPGDAISFHGLASACKAPSPFSN